MEGDQLFHFLPFRENDFDGNAVALADGLHHAIGLIREAAGIEGEDADIGGDARREVEDHHAFLLEAGGDGELIAEGIDSPRKDVRSVMPPRSAKKLSLNLYQD